MERKKNFKSAGFISEDEVIFYEKLRRELTTQYKLDSYADQLLLDRFLFNIIKAKRAEVYEAEHGMIVNRIRELVRSGQTAIDIVESPTTKIIDKLDANIIKFAHALALSKKARNPLQIDHSFTDLSKMLSKMRTETIEVKQKDGKEAKITKTYIEKTEDEEEEEEWEKIAN